MISILAALALQAGSSGGPVDIDIRCGFTNARELATATTEPADSIAEKVVAACTADTSKGPIDDARRQKIRAAALAMVNRSRGMDGEAPDAPFRLPQVESSLEIPDEIAPAVMPYMLCQVASAGVPMYTEGKKALIPPPPGITKGSDCGAARAKAATDADRMLKRAGRKGKAERGAYVEKVLRDMDEFHAASQARRSQSTDTTD